jgi:hypothetical protein
VRLREHIGLAPHSAPKYRIWTRWWQRKEFSFFASAESGMKRRAASFPCHRLRRRFIPIFILFHFLSRSLKHDVTLRAPDHLFAIFKFFISTPMHAAVCNISSLTRSHIRAASECVCLLLPFLVSTPAFYPSNLREILAQEGTKHTHERI